MSIKVRTQSGQGCPYCGGQRVLAGFNDLATTAPEEAAHWHPTLNNDLTPQEVSAGSNKLVWWHCSEGHEVHMSPKSWLYGHCRYCSGRKLLVGFNDVFTKAPHLHDEWDFEKNTVDPLTLRFNERNYRAHWLCRKCGNRWEAIVRSRVKGSGCARCAVNHSNLEESLLKLIEELYDGPILLRQRILRDPERKNPLEVDIHLPELNLGFEVQDFTTHSRDSDEEELIFRNRRNPKKPFKKGPTYHARKRALFVEQYGGELMEVWEDEILGDKEVRPLSSEACQRKRNRSKASDRRRGENNHAIT